MCVSSFCFCTMFIAMRSRPVYVCEVLLLLCPDQCTPTSDPTTAVAMCQGSIRAVSKLRTRCDSSVTFAHCHFFRREATKCQCVSKCCIAEQVLVVLKQSTAAFRAPVASSTCDPVAPTPCMLGSLNVHNIFSTLNVVLMFFK